MASFSESFFPRPRSTSIHFLLIECLHGIHKPAPAGLENQAKRAADFLAGADIGSLLRGVRIRNCPLTQKWGNMLTSDTSLLRPLRLFALTGIAISGSLLISGCGIGTAAGPAEAPTSLSITGHVHGGQSPVTLSNVGLFATANSGISNAGYGKSATLLATTTTDVNGDFTITSSYTCPSTQQAYVVATGGNPGLTSGTDNSAIFMVAALGPCTNIANVGVIDMNEVTTVAAAYALSGFLPAGGAGMTEAAFTGTSVNGTMPGITTSAANTQGLTDAFNNAANIVDLNTGLAYTVAPSNTNSEVPQPVIHALADILQNCANSTGPTSSYCTSLFAAATPPSGSGIAAPVNVFQAAIDIANYPSNNVGTLFSLLSTSPAFPTSLAAAPTDWTVAVAYTGSTMVSTSGLGISSNDTVYVAGTGYLIDFTAQGAPINTANILTGVPSGDALRYMAFDSSGDLFIADGNKASTDTKVYELSSTSAVSVLNYGSVATDANTYNIAVDNLGDVWTSTYSKATCSSVGCSLVEFAKGSSSYTPYNTFSTFTAPQPTGAVGGARGIAFDVNTGNIWITAIDDNLAELFKVTPVSGGSAATATAAPVQITGLGTEVSSPGTNVTCGTISVAVDKNANAWFMTSGGPSSSCGSTTAAALSYVPSGITSTTAGTVVTASTSSLSTPIQLIIDGNNNIFIANSGNNSIAQYNTTLAAFESGTAGFIPTEADALHTVYQPSYLEVDRSGALWVSSSGKGATTSAALIQILGVAAPTNPVQSAGQYGIKP